MALTARSGPGISFGALISGSTDGITGNAATGGYNGQRAPDLSDLGFALMDPRAAYQYQPGGDVSDPVVGFYNNRGYYDFVPVAVSSIAIVSVTASSSLASAALTLQAASTARGTYTANIVAPESGLTISGILTCDSSGPQFNVFGTTGTVKTWNPGFGPGRCVTVQVASNLDSPITVHGRDVYGYKISEAIAASSSGIAGVKAFKFIDAVYNSSTPSSTGITVGFTDKLGMPLYCPYASGDIAIRISSGVSNSSFPIALTSAVFIVGSTAAQTTTSVDPRGVYISTTALTTNYRVTISVTPAASAAAAITVSDMSGFFGQTQYSS